MERNNTIVLVIVGILILGGLLVFSSKGFVDDSGDGAGQNNKELYDKAPDFALEDYDGNTVRLSGFQGTVAVVNSWATWCPFCVDELVDFAKLQEEFGDIITVIAIDRAESPSKVKEFGENLGVAGRMLFLLDPDDSFYESIGGFSMPETIFIDAGGNIRVHKRGPMKLDEMREKVNSILNE
jgi:thiol-disulfide isomerase/thioredoxin